MNHRSSGRVCALLAWGLVSSAVRAVEPTASVFMDSGLTSTGAKLVSTVAQGQVDTAFADAASVAYVRDPAVIPHLDKVRSDAAAVAPALGASLRPVVLLSVPSTIYPGCEYREYRTEYVGGTQFWRLKFRRAADGWKLADVDLRTELKAARSNP